jgi:hypothetical protein
VHLVGLSSEAWQLMTVFIWTLEAAAMTKSNTEPVGHLAGAVTVAYQPYLH